MTHTNLVQRIESGILFAATFITFLAIGGTWWFYLLLLLAPDISMIGYIKNARWGAYFYNAGHSLALPLILGVFGLLTHTPLAQQLALIWLGHAGFDRVQGYGLKETDSFTHTHLGRIGRAK
jgi:hypothetical protein